MAPRLEGSRAQVSAGVAVGLIRDYALGGKSVRVYLVRHAKAQKRSRWDAPDSRRPLTDVGRLQAEGIEDALESERPTRVITSPHARCRQTLEPLASRVAVPIELDSRLAEGSSFESVRSLLDSLGDQTVVLCSHGDVIRGTSRR